MNGKGMGGDRIHEFPVVGDQKQGSLPFSEKTAEPSQTDDIEVVVRLVEQQQVGIFQQRLGEVQSHLEST